MGLGRVPSQTTIHAVERLVLKKHLTSNMCVCACERMYVCVCVYVYEPN